MGALHNVSGISKKRPQSRNKALFVMYIIINWSHPTKFSIEQEPLKIFEICDTFIFLALQSTHMPNYVILPINKGVISLSKKAKICERQGKSI